ncbi:hypothetical protein ACH6EH_06715 [Paenibacillus sp. JSM ZJ436]|uniref:hypothetical protein n=1 Tax=Paenibacillus sp. JSM ZJ436 TaxID=3376190 RepID=UPI003799A205
MKIKIVLYDGTVLKTTVAKEKFTDVSLKLIQSENNTIKFFCTDDLSVRFSDIKYIKKLS